MRARFISCLMNISLLRGLVFFFVFLFLFGFLVDPVVKTNPLEIGKMIKANPYCQLGSRDDPRLFNVPPQKSSEAMTIAWITDSSYQILDSKRNDPDSFVTRTTLFDLVLAENEERKGRNLRIVYYPFWGTGILDKYFGVLHAISQHPDLIIVTLNPVWDFNSRAFFVLSQLPGASIKYIENFASAKYVFLFGEPSQLLSGMLSCFKAFGDRYDLSKSIAALLSKIDFVKKKDRDASVFLSKKEDPYAYRFFNKYINVTGRNYLSAKNLPPSSRIQLTGLYYNDMEETSFTMKIYRDMLDTLKQSGIKTYIYSFPFDLKQLEAFKELDLKYAAYERSLLSVSMEYKGSNLNFDIAGPSRLKGLKFYDMSHLNQTGDFPAYLLAQIVRISGGRVKGVLK
jgi:hypothetical protein